MYAQEFAQRYSHAQVTSITPKQLLLLMFDGGLRFLRQARTALAADDLRVFCESLSRAAAIVSELQATLDKRQGGDIAIQLDRLYDFMMVRLSEANATRSVRPLEDALRVLDTIADGYRAIIGGVPAVQAA